MAHSLDGRITLLELVHPDENVLIVHQGASIGANATILPGINIGIHAMIGAGAVVIKDVKPYALVVGNPSRQVGWMSEFGQRLEFNTDGLAICSESGGKYKLLDGNVSKI